MRGVLSDADHRRLLDLFSKAGLTMDHHQFDEDVLERGTKAILKTRDGILRAAVPSPLGDCMFLNDVPQHELFAALRLHKAIVKEYPRNGEGIEAYVDASDTGYTVNGEVAELTNGHADGLEKIKVLNDDTKTINGECEPSMNGVSQPNRRESPKRHDSPQFDASDIGDAVHMEASINGTRA